MICRLTANFKIILMYSLYSRQNRNSA